MKSPLVLIVLSLCSLAADQLPMQANFQDSASYRWLNKPALESRILDDMSSLAGWSTFTTGPEAVVDSRVEFKPTRASHDVAQISVSRDHSRDGRESLLLRLPTRLDGPGPRNGRGWGETGVVHHFNGEDWQRFNRVSLWIYPDCPMAYVVSMVISLQNNGVEKLPAAFGQEGENDVILRNQQWNHVVWEIGNVARDKVVGLTFTEGLVGNEPEAPDFAAFYFDHLVLERVQPDYVEGWGVWPGRISYSQAGYQTASPKTAIASGLSARDFRLVDQATGESVLHKPVAVVTTGLGTFQVMDFSEVHQSGTYVLETGDTLTHPFVIGPNIWRESILKALNFFYGERCGFALPGVHGICHRDWTAVHGDRRMVINGGWHDAGDLTQGLGNTGEVAYGMFSLAERLQATGEDPALYNRVLEEARWGLDWILKTSFGDGYRATGSISSRRTNSIIGDDDDLTATANNVPRDNFVASAAEAIAYRVLKQSDPRWAAYCLRMAQADWSFAVAGMAHPAEAPSPEMFEVSFDSHNVVHEVPSIGILASLDLFKDTGEQRYADKAVELARIILDSQQRAWPDWKVPFTGFFYTSPARDRLLHYVHRGREQGPDLALTRLCEALPNHPDWMKWYSAVVLHSNFVKSISRYTEPYGVIPGSIYKDDEYLNAPASRRESFRQQVLNGIPLGSGHYLRRFPVWMDYRGHFGVILPQAQALANAARLRGDLEAAQLAELQAEWIIGRNPFAQSTMWGEGYDFTPLDTPSSGDIVGALPVGIQTRGTSDVPYWPVQNVWTYKEVWVHPTGRWIWLMRDVAGPAVVEGQAAAKAEFRDIISGRRTETGPGQFRLSLPQGKYEISSTGDQQTRVFFSGEVYHVDLRPGHTLAFDVTQQSLGSGDVVIRVSARGSGSHRFALRTDNLTLDTPAHELTLRPGSAGTLEWHARITSADTPWVAVVIPDDDLILRKEIAEPSR